MKTAEEWCLELDMDLDHCKMFGAIQLDAFKAGAEWTARIADRDYTFRGDIIKRTILTAAANLKEIPKV